MCAQRSSLNAPQPHKTISCQQLLQEDVSHSGWLRKRTKIHKSIKLVVKFIPWINKYTVLSKGCMYVFDSESSKKPSGAFTLHGYNNINRAGEVVHSDAPWSFKLMPVDCGEERMRYFSASSEREMKKWMVEIKKQMMFANGQGCRISHKKYTGRGSASREDGDGSATYSDIEDDVYQRSCDIRLAPTDDIESDDDDQRDYNEIEEFTDGHDVSDTTRSPSNRRNMPLPLPPKLGAAPPDVKPKQLKKSMSDVSPDVHQRPPLATPGKIKPLPPAVDPPDEDFEDHSSTVPPLPASPSSPDKPPVRSSSTAVSGTVNALREKFANKPVIAPRPGVNKVPPRLPSKPSHDVEDSPAASKPDVTSRPPPPTPGTRERLPLPVTRDGPEGTDNPEQDYLDDIFWNGDKEEANRVLNDIGQEGVYLIRSSENKEKVLVVYAEGGARKYRIQKDDGQVWISSDTQFNTIQEMLDYYHTTELPKRSTMLTRPYNR